MNSSINMGAMAKGEVITVRVDEERKRRILAALAKVQKRTPQVEIYARPRPTLSEWVLSLLDRAEKKELGR